MLICPGGLYGLGGRAITGTMRDSSVEPTGHAQYQCPGCGELVSPAALSGSLFQCPRCGRQFFAAAVEDVPEESETLDSTSGSHPDEPLSELRIKQVSGLRRAAYRSRSWVIIAAGVCLVAGLKLLLTSITDIRAGRRAMPIGYGLAAVALFMIGGHLVRRAVAMTRRIQEARQPDPAEPPDLSTLSDGSQRWKSLEDMGRNDT